MHSRFTRWALVGGPTLAWLLLGWILFGQTGRFSLAAVEKACGLAAPDVRPLPTSQYLAAFADGCGTTGLLSYRDLQLVDLLYPAALAVVQSLALLAMLGPRGRSLRWLLALPLLTALGDYVENCAAWLWITQDDRVPGWTVTVFQAGSMIKVVAGGATWLLLSWLAFRAILRWRPLVRRAPERAGELQLD